MTIREQTTLAEVTSALEALRDGDWQLDTSVVWGTQAERDALLERVDHAIAAGKALATNEPEPILDHSAVLEPVL